MAYWLEAGKYQDYVLQYNAASYTLAVQRRAQGTCEKHTRLDTAWSAHCEGDFQYISHPNSQWDFQFITVPLSPLAEIVEALAYHQNRFRLEAAETADQPVARKNPGRKRKV